MKQFKLGVTVRDLLTGFEGVATGKSTYLTGCDQYLVQPVALKDRDIVDGRWFDAQRLELVSDKNPVVLDNGRLGDCGCAPIK